LKPGFQAASAKPAELLAPQAKHRPQQATALEKRP
jgi:hypothetical protein